MSVRIDRPYLVLALHCIAAEKNCRSKPILCLVENSMSTLLPDAHSAETDWLLYPLKYIENIPCHLLGYVWSDNTSPIIFSLLGLVAFGGVHVFLFDLGEVQGE